MTIRNFRIVSLLTFKYLIYKNLINTNLSPKMCFPEPILDFGNNSIPDMPGTCKSKFYE